MLHKRHVSPRVASDFTNRLVSHLGLIVTSGWFGRPTGARGLLHGLCNLIMRLKHLVLGGRLAQF